MRLRWPGILAGGLANLYGPYSMVERYSKYYKSLAKVSTRNTDLRYTNGVRIKCYSRNPILSVYEHEILSSHFQLDFKLFFSYF